MTDDKPFNDLERELPPWLCARFRRWLSVNGAFRSFVREYAIKVRMKLAQARDPEDKADVVAELEVAHRLLIDPRFRLRFEPYGNSRRRSPDFLVEMSEAGGFHLEVKRIRETQAMLDARAAAPPEDPVEIPFTQRESFKFSDLIVGCLGQLRPGSANVLAVAVHSSTHDAHDLAAAIHGLRGAVRRRDDAYFRRKGFEGTDDFVGQVDRLSAVVVTSIWTPIGPSASGSFVWPNSNAQHKLQQDVLTFFRAF